MAFSTDHWGVGFVEEMVFGRRYRVTEKIGSGGMAEVFKAVDETLGRTVAVKVMHPRYAQDPAFAARFRQEAQAAANLQSPYIVNVYDWGQDGETYYIVMEYVRGSDLKSLILDRGPMDSKRVADIGAQVCAALSVAHGYDVIHRDIKPHNIMVTPDGSVKVMDFGIALAGNTTMTQTGSVLGTAHYVSPEQAQGRPLTARSDLYSLGIVLYEAATGRLPFDAETPVAVALKQVNEAPRPPRQVRPSIDAGLEAVIMKAMAKRPEDRYDTASEMRRDLLQVAAGGAVTGATAVVPMAAPAPAGRANPTAVMPAAAAAAAVRPVPKKRFVWPWILLAVLLVVAGLGLAWGMGLIGSQPVAVPNVVGLPIEDARLKLKDAGFQNVNENEDFSRTAPAGEVIAQDPQAKQEVSAKTPINLTISKGQQKTSVPDLFGKTREEARALLQQAQLTPNEKDEYSSKYDEGTVFKQNPAAGTELAVGDSVEVVISRGKKTVVVPDVTGKSSSTARSMLEAEGLKMVSTKQFDDNVPVGQVISQNPSAGIELVEGSTVNVVVSKGPQFVTVPDVIGSTIDAATQTLEAQGFKVTVNYEPHAENGLVIDQTPKNGAKVSKGATVTILVDMVAP